MLRVAAPDIPFTHSQQTASVVTIKAARDPKRRPVKVAIVLCGKITRQLVVSAFSASHCNACSGVFPAAGFLLADGFDMHHERLVLRQINGLSRHEYLAVEVGVKSDHGRRITGCGYARKTFPVRHRSHIFHPAVGLWTSLGLSETAVRAD
jgi:hypothetical protein